MFSPSVLPKILTDFQGSDVEINTERYRSGHNGADSKSVCGLKPHVGSNPTPSAISSIHNGLELWILDFLLFAISNRMWYNDYEKQSLTIPLLRKCFVDNYLKPDIIESQKRF